MENTPYALTKRAKELNTDVKTMVKDALREANGDIYEAADNLKISRQTLLYHMDKKKLKLRFCVVDESELIPSAAPE